MHRIFQRFIDHLAQSADRTDFRDSLAEVATALDLNCFAYLSLPGQTGGKPLHITTYPIDWTAHYLRKHYERMDPVIRQALVSSRPFEWGLEQEPHSHSELQRQLLDEASQFGIRCGFTVPIHDGHGPIAAVTFAADVQQVADFRRRIERYEKVLQLVAMYFHAHVRRKLGPGRKIDGIQLSQRELECLEWAAQGKSAWEIGRILGISRHTAASYLDNAKEKLGVRTLVQAAIRLAAAKGEQQK